MIFLVGCSNDFELTEGKQELPIVYGMINMQDTATYIRVEKSFVDENIGANILAQDPKNLYFENIGVSLKVERNGQSFELQRVDGNLEGYVRKEGLFANSPNYLYKVHNNLLRLRGGDKVKLSITKEDGSLLTESETTVLTPYESFDISNPSTTGILSFLPSSNTRFNWVSNRISVIHNVMLRIKIKELTGNNFEDKELVWILGRNIDKNEVSISGASFFEFLRSNLDQDPFKTRFIENITFELQSGGEALRDYITVGNANIGITSSGEIPTYTNLTNGARGLFTSSTIYKRDGLSLASRTLDSLRRGSVTGQLNFK